MGRHKEVGGIGRQDNGQFDREAISSHCARLSNIDQRGKSILVATISNRHLLGDNVVGLPLPQLLDCDRLTTRIVGANDHHATNNAHAKKADKGSPDLPRAIGHKRINDLDKTQKTAH